MPRSTSRHGTPAHAMLEWNADILATTDEDDSPPPKTERIGFDGARFLSQRGQLGSHVENATHNHPRTTKHARTLTHTHANSHSHCTSPVRAMKIYMVQCSMRTTSLHWTESSRHAAHFVRWCATVRVRMFEGRCHMNHARPPFDAVIANPCFNSDNHATPIMLHHACLWMHHSQTCVL